MAHASTHEFFSSLRLPAVCLRTGACASALSALVAASLLASVAQPGDALPQGGSAPASQPGAAQGEDADPMPKDAYSRGALETIREMKRLIDRTNGIAKENVAKLPAGFKPKDPPDPDATHPDDAKPCEFEFFYNGDSKGTKIVPRPYLLAIQKDGAKRTESYAESFGEIFGALFRTFYERYSKVAGLRALDTTPVPVWVFRSQGQYERWRRSGNPGPSTSTAGAFYSGTEKNNRSGFLFLWLQDPQENKSFTGDQIESIRETAWHEGTHQLMDFNSPGRGFDLTNSPWMQEGFAEYVSGYDRLLDKKQPDGWRYFFGLPQIDRVKAVMALGLEKVDHSTMDELIELKPSMREIATMSYLEFWTARATLESKVGGAEGKKASDLFSGTYSIGWALCHFLQHYEEGKYRKQFHDWLKSELNKHSGEMPGAMFEKIFGLDSDDKWSDFQLEFQEHCVSTLRPDQKKRIRRDTKLMEKYRKSFEEAVGQG
ncbi:MAG: hypothetical protein JNJ88_20590 [Planctomycetes bacterium]|nr:hypothetical protein [Planctomycetota bacterium]